MQLLPHIPYVNDQLRFTISTKETGDRPKM